MLRSGADGPAELDGLVEQMPAPKSPADVAPGTINASIVMIEGLPPRGPPDDDDENEEDEEDDGEEKEEPALIREPDE
jgi:hypothetical protein